MLLGDAKPKEGVLLEEPPHLVRNVLLVPNPPVVDDSAELLGRSVEERPLLVGERNGRNGAQLVPVRPAAEELGIEPDGARTGRLPRDLREPGQRAPNGPEGRRDKD